MGRDSVEMDMLLRELRKVSIPPLQLFTGLNAFSIQLQLAQIILGV